jgi:hypothetical protein
MELSFSTTVDSIDLDKPIKLAKCSCKTESEQRRIIKLKNQKDDTV